MVCSNFGIARLDLALNGIHIYPKIPRFGRSGGEQEA